MRLIPVDKIMGVLIKNILFLLFYPLKLFIRTEDVVILETYNRYRYGGNPKYLFEYLSRHSNLTPYWATESDEITAFLEAEGLKYISNKRFLHKLLVTLKAKVVISSGTGFYDPFFLISRDKQVLKICTMHGSGPKLTVVRYDDVNKSINIIKKMNAFDCVSFCTEHSRVTVGINQYFLSRNRTKLLGAPKCDILLDSEYVYKKYKNKHYVSELIPLYNLSEDREKSKIVYYVPTFRPYKSNFPIIDLKGFDEGEFNLFLDRNNIYFIYSNHSSSSFDSLLKQSDRIKYLSTDKYPLFDNLNLILEVDMLVGDYSTLASDFAVLKRPQLFIMPDYKQNYINKGFAEDVRSLLPGKEVNSFSDLLVSIEKYIGDPVTFMNDYGKGVDKLLSKYIDTSITNSRRRFERFICEKIK